MTDEEINTRLHAHAKQLRQAEAENWTLLPVPLDVLAFDLRMQQLRERNHAQAL